MADTGETRQLLDNARRGDRGAFDELSSRVRRAMLGWLGRRLSGPLGKKLDPEDVLQEVLLRAFRSFRDFRGEDAGSFRCWLEGIGHNIIRNHSRLQGWRRELHVEREVAADDVSPSRRERRQERLARLNASVEALSEDYRTVIRLARIDGLKIKQIAERLNRSESAVKNLLLRAIQKEHDGGDARIVVGGNDPLRLRLNGVEIGRFTSSPAAYSPDRICDAALRAGTNRLVVWIRKTDGRSGLSIRFEDENGSPIRVRQRL